MGNIRTLLLSVTLSASIFSTKALADGVSMPLGNYSGITWIDGNQFAIISDKHTGTGKDGVEGWQRVNISFKNNGKVKDVEYVGTTTFKDANGNDILLNDCEGIAFVPSDNHDVDNGTFFIASEGTQTISEYDNDGRATGRFLAIPAECGKDMIYPNYGFESLAYNHTTRTFWTTTEQGLRTDCPLLAANGTHNGKDGSTLVRLMAFENTSSPDIAIPMTQQYAYRTEPKTAKKNMRIYVMGIAEITALDDGSLLVLEREMSIPKGYIGGKCRCKIFRVMPHEDKAIDFNSPLKDLPQDAFLQKTLVAEWSTGITRLTNYEGMCLCPTLLNTNSPLILISDSQNHKRKKVLFISAGLKEKIKTLNVNKKLTVNN